MELVGNSGTVMSEDSSMLAVQPGFLADDIVHNSNTGPQSEIIVYHNNPNIQRDMEVA